MNNNTNSKNTILQAALNLFSEKGYEAVSVNEIVQAAGITKPTLYYFFQSKEGVFKEILEQNYGRFNDILKSISVYESHIRNYENDVFPVLKKIANTYFKFATENSVFYLMILSLTFSPPTALTTIISEDYHRAQYKIITNLFINISKVHGNIKGKELQCAFNFIAIINANIGFWYHGFGEINSKKAEDIVHQFMHGIFA